MTSEEIDDAFTYHPPDAAQARAYERIRAEAKALAETIATLCPSSREQSLAFTKLRESIMWANAAIAIHTVNK